MYTIADDMENMEKMGRTLEKENKQVRRTVKH